MVSVRTQTLFTVLCAESDARRRRLLHHAFTRASVATHFAEAEDGEAALDYLHRRGAYLTTVAPRPDLVLMDIELPNHGAIEALRKLKGDAGLRRIPVLVFTNRATAREVQIVYDAGANAVTFRPMTFDAAVHVVESLSRYWLSMVTLPSR